MCSTGTSMAEICRLLRLATQRPEHVTEYMASLASRISRYANPIIRAKITTPARQPPQINPKPRTIFTTTTQLASKAPTSTAIKTQNLSTPRITMSTSTDHILTLSCPDRPGIIHAVTGLLSAHDLNILDLQQFSDPDSQKFFMRVHFGHAASLTHLTTPLEQLSTDLKLDYYELKPVATKPKVLIMVSKIGHCLNDLLFRTRNNQLNIQIPLIISNHPDFRPLAESYGIPFHHLPVSKDTKALQESQILKLIEQHDIDLVVLARYMQVLSPTLCSAMSGKIINIHHSFLPSFKGAKPYHQAYERGVKIIGATAHFVTKDLDEGPIIEQRVARVDHGMGPAELVEEGSHVESLVLAAAVKWWSERRVFLNGAKTVVFN